MKSWTYVVAVLFIMGLVGISSGEIISAPERSENLAKVNLVEDIIILGEMIGHDLLSYPMPNVKILPADAFNKRIAEEAAKGTISPDEYVGLYTCEENWLLINAGYSEIAVKNRLEPHQFFLLIRIHELYHWTMCQAYGRHRFRVNQDLLQPVDPRLVLIEEEEARKIERRYLTERLGKRVVTKEEFFLPSPPRVPRTLELFPKDQLFSTVLLWTGGDYELQQKETEGDGIIFVYIFWAKVYAEDILEYHLMSHKGKYVRVYVLKNGAPYREWIDIGYVGKADQRNFAADPVYQGEWVRLR